MRDLSGFKRWARTQLFRAWTALAVLGFFGLCFIYRPELVSWWLRTTMRMIESGSGALPYPWGDRVEVALKGFGGSFWFQITLAIVMLRILAWALAASWRKTRAKGSPSTMTTDTAQIRKRSEELDRI